MNIRHLSTRSLNTSATHIQHRPKIVQLFLFVLDSFLHRVKNTKLNCSSFELKIYIERLCVEHTDFITVAIDRKSFSRQTMKNRDGSDGRDARGEHFIDSKQLSPEQYILKDSPNDIRNFGWFQTHAHARLRWKIGSFWCESKIVEPKIDDKMTMEHFSAKKSVRMVIVQQGLYLSFQFYIFARFGRKSMNNKRAFRTIPSSEGWFLKTFNVRLRCRLQTPHRMV